MNRKATLCNVPTKAKPRIYNKVFDRSHRRIRGLWYRDGKFYFQTRINGDVKQIELHEATTIAQAVEAMQVLKTKIRKGEYVSSDSPAAHGPAVASPVFAEETPAKSNNAQIIPRSRNGRNFSAQRCHQFSQVPGTNTRAIPLSGTLRQPTAQKHQLLHQRFQLPALAVVLYVAEQLWLSNTKSGQNIANRLRSSKQPEEHD